MAFRARLIAGLIANEIAPNGSGFDSLRDCSLVDCVLVDFYSRRVVPGLTVLGPSIALQEYCIYYTSSTKWFKLVLNLKYRCYNVKNKTIKFSYLSIQPFFELISFFAFHNFLGPLNTIELKHLLFTKLIF